VAMAMVTAMVIRTLPRRAILSPPDEDIMKRWTVRREEKSATEHGKSKKNTPACECNIMS
jgi:hypothetical protein